MLVVEGCAAVGTTDGIAVGDSDRGKVGARVGIAVGAGVGHVLTAQKGPLVEVGVVL